MKPRRKRRHPLLTPMLCPFCGHKEDKVIDSRESREGEIIRRRRECLGCAKRFTTYEKIDEIPYMVVKKDGRREKFDRQKVLSGLLKASEKRPISMARLADIIDAVENRLAETPDRELTTTEIGEMIMDQPRGARQDRLCTFCVGLSRLPGCGGFPGRTEQSDAAQKTVASAT